MQDFLETSYWQKATPKSVERAIEYGADANARSKAGRTSLHYASMYSNDLNVLIILIDEGVDVNARDRQGKTTLMFASDRNKNPEIIEFLIDEGADVNERDKDGSTALMWASWRTDNPEIITTLIDEGADINARNKKGETAWDLLQYNPKLKRNKKLAALLEPSRRDSYRGDYRPTRLDRTRRISRRYR